MARTIRRRRPRITRQRLRAQFNAIDLLRETVALRYVAMVDLLGLIMQRIGTMGDIKPLGTDQFDGQVAAGDDSHASSQPQFGRLATAFVG